MEVTRPKAEKYGPKALKIICPKGDILVFANIMKLQF